jgi:hypothetical protein
MCHRPARERWRLRTRSRGLGPSVCKTKCPWLRKSNSEGLFLVWGAAKSKTPCGARGWTSIERWDLESKHSVNLGSTSKPSPAQSSPAQPSPALPISRRICDACKFQVTGRGASKLVGASDGPEAPRRCTERVLAVLPAAAGSLGWAGTDQDARATGLGSAFPPTPVPPSHHHSALPSESQPSALGVPASGSVCEAPGHSLCSH